MQKSDVVSVCWSEDEEEEDIRAGGCYIDLENAIFKIGISQNIGIFIHEWIVGFTLQCGGLT